MFRAMRDEVAPMGAVRFASGATTSLKSSAPSALVSRISVGSPAKDG